MVYTLWCHKARDIFKGILPTYSKTVDAMHMAGIAKCIGRCIVSTLFLLLLGCAEREGTTADSEAVWYFKGPTMGTQYTIKLYPPGEAPDTDGIPSKSHIQSEINALLARVNSAMSTYLSDSELSKFNRSPAKVSYEISYDTYHVMQMAQHVHLASDGFFDVTVGPLVELWGFGPKARRASPPSDEAIAAALEDVGHDALTLDVSAAHDSPIDGSSPIEQNRRFFLTKHRPLSVDLSAIAKGYAVDLVAGYLRTLGAKSFLVEIGGEVSTSGRKPGGESWRIALEEPQPGVRAVQGVLKLEDVAVATSGNYRNFFEHNGTRYAHSINPNTGWPVRHGLASVTVLMPAEDVEVKQSGAQYDSGWQSRTALADAWATALLVAGPDHAERLAEKEGLAAIFIFENEEGGYTERATAAAQRFRSN